MWRVISFFYYYSLLHLVKRKKKNNCGKSIKCDSSKVITDSPFKNKLETSLLESTEKMGAEKKEPFQGENKKETLSVSNNCYNKECGRRAVLSYLIWTIFPI